jgi:hypothetical protein
MARQHRSLTYWCGATSIIGSLSLLRVYISDSKQKNTAVGTAVSLGRKRAGARRAKPLCNRSATTSLGSWQAYYAASSASSSNGVLSSFDKICGIRSASLAASSSPLGPSGRSFPHDAQPLR